MFLVNIAKKIYILEYGPEIKADKQNQYIASKSGKIEIITNAKVKEIKGDKFIESIVYEDKKSGKEKILSLEGVFVEIGYKPNASFIKDLVDFNKNGEIEVDLKNYQTKTPGLFAVGDVNSGDFKQIIIACGEGATASLSAFNYLKKHE